MDTSPLAPLYERLKKIEAEIEALTCERAEVRSALEVFERYMKETAGTDRLDVASTPESPKMPRVRFRRRAVATGSPRPEGIPTIWEMTESILSDAPDRTMTALEVIEKISELWWPGATKSQIAPTLYKFAKEERLVQVDKGTFQLPTESESAGSEKPKTEHVRSMPGFLNPNQMPNRQ